MLLELAVALWLVFVVVPGLAILRIVRVPISFGGSAVLAAPVSFGFLYLLGLLATRANASTQTVCSVGLALLIAAWIAVEVSRLRCSSAGVTTPHDGSQVSRRNAWRNAWRNARHLKPQCPQLALSRALLVVAVVAGMVLWRLVQSRLLVPSGWDAMHHAYFVKQIVEHHTLRPQVVLSSDPSRADGTTGFYPLAANLVAALVNVSSGVRISAVLLASTVALAGVLLPTGVYVMVRRLAPNIPVVAGLAAIAAVLPARLYTVVYTGRITIVLGMALVPATVTLLLLWKRRIDWRLAIIAPLAAIGVFGVHTSELPIAGLVVLAVAVLWAAHDRAWRDSFAWFAYVLAIGAFTGSVVYLSDPSVIHVVSERTGAFGSATGMHLQFGLAVERTVALSAPFPAHNAMPMSVWSAIALVGCAVTVHSRLRAVRGFAVAYLLWASYYLLWLWGHLGPAAKLADLWYRETQRMLWEFTVLGAVPVGIALYALVALLYGAVVRVGSRGPRAVERRRTFSVGGAVLGAAALVVTLVFITPPALTDAAWLRTYASPVSRDSERAFAFLAAHVGPHDRVLDDLENHGDLWMYADYGVPTVFGNPPLLGGAPLSWKDRMYLRGQLKHITTDPCVSRLVHAYGVEYVFYSTARMWGGRPKITLGALRDTRHFRQVFRAGSVRVFEVIEATPRQTACTRDIAALYPWSTTANAK